MNITRILLISTFTASSLFAHNLWLNSFESFSKKGGHVTVSMGRGHSLSIDDSVKSNMVLSSFDLIDPIGKKIALKKPSTKLVDIYISDKLKIVDSNLAMQKISFNENSIKGTYTTAFARKTSYFTKYINKNGKEVFKREEKEKIKDSKEILSSSKINTFAKNYFVFGKWTQPKAIGHNLEIIPTNDISKLKAGDTITFDVIYKGKALNSGYITASSDFIPKSNELFSKIRKGKAKFILPHNGSWLFNLTHKEDGDITLINKTTVTVNIN